MWELIPAGQEEATRRREPAGTRTLREQAWVGWGSEQLPLHSEGAPELWGVRVDMIWWASSESHGCP